MMTFPFFRPVLFRAPDAGGGMGEGTAPNTEPAQEPEKEKAAQEAAAQNPPAAQEQPAEKAENPPGQEDRQEDKPDPEKRLEAAQQRILTAELRSAAALAGVAKERIPYVLKLADTASIDLDANDAGEKIEAAIDKVLADLPELRGGAGGTGSAGNFARKTGEAEDPDMARIRKNILG